MEKSQRKSSRQVKLLRDPDFVYDVEGVRSQARRVSSSSESSNTESVYPASDNSGKINVATSWSNKVNFPTSDCIVQDNSDYLAIQRKKEAIRTARRVLNSEPRSSSVNQEEENQEEESANVNKDSRRRHISSTRETFLNLSECFLSVSSTFNTDTSEMSSNSEKGCGECEECTQGQVCCVPSRPSVPAGATNVDDVMAKMLRTLELQSNVLKKVDRLADEVKDLKGIINEQNVKISVQDRAINNLLESDDDVSSSVRRRVKLKRGITDAKKDRVEEEKTRTLSVAREFITSPEECDASAEDELDIRELRKKMTGQHREQCNRKVSSRLKEVGAAFPEDNFDTTSNSGTDSYSIDEKCKHSRQVKSGAKVKKRPVLYTELWPHTIAIEDDGEDVSCENISLAKFFSCFTYIMLGCGTKEARGRSCLLHAVSTVLEFLQWSEARTFHNIMVVKIEQGIMDWSTDFGPLAEKFVDKKVRLGMKSRSTGAGRSSFSKASYAGKSFGKGFGGASGSSYRGASGTGRGRTLGGAVCFQWNFGTCTYGRDCKRWHVCKTCADSGKLGEQHKASTHESSGSRSRPPQDS